MNKKDDELVERQDCIEDDDDRIALEIPTTEDLIVATAYYYELTRLHTVLHPVFFLGGFLTAYWVL